MSEYAAQTDAELEARCDDLYTQIMAGFDSLPLATYSPEYKAAKREIQRQEIEFRGICVELAHRLYERTSRWTETAQAVTRSDAASFCEGGC